MTKEYYLDPSLLETCHSAINVESIRHKSIARIVASTQQRKVKHKQRRPVQVAGPQILGRRNGVSTATNHCIDPANPLNHEFSCVGVCEYTHATAVLMGNPKSLSGSLNRFLGYDYASRHLLC
jgi:hypothetical protein